MTRASKSRRAKSRQSDDEDERTSNSRTARFAKRTTRRVTSRESAAPQISHAHDHVNDHSRAKARPTATPRALGANQRAAHDSCANPTSPAQSHPSDSSGPLSSSSPGSRHTRHATPRARASSLDAAPRASRVVDGDDADAFDRRVPSACLRDIDPNPNVASARASPAFAGASVARGRSARRASRVARVIARREAARVGRVSRASRREVTRSRGRSSRAPHRVASIKSINQSIVPRGGEASRSAIASATPDGSRRRGIDRRRRRSSTTRATTLGASTRSTRARREPSGDRCP